MEGYRISKSWLTRKLYRGDELWHFDEPAPTGINAGALGIALVSDGEPIATAITTIH